MSFKDFLNEQKQVSKQLIENQKKRELLKKEMKSLIEQVNLLEKAVSKSQQRLMGMAHAYKKDGTLPDDPALASKVKEIADGMTKSDVEDFATTKHDDLPEVKKESFKITNPLIESILYEKDSNRFKLLIESAIGNLWKDIKGSVGKGVSDFKSKRLIGKVGKELEKIQKEFGQDIDKVQGKVTPLLDKYLELTQKVINKLKDTDKKLDTVTGDEYKDEVGQIKGSIKDHFGNFRRIEQSIKNIIGTLGKTVATESSKKGKKPVTKIPDPEKRVIGNPTSAGEMGKHKKSSRYDRRKRKQQGYSVED